MTTDINFDARYAIDGWKGIAFYLLGYDDGQRDWDPKLNEYVPNTDWVRAVMVGDDREHVVSVDDLTPLDDLGYCAECGQIGCEHDGRERPGL